VTATMVPIGAVAESAKAPSFVVTPSSGITVSGPVGGNLLERSVFDQDPIMAHGKSDFRVR
jgi:hypothetical protein